MTSTPSRTIVISDSKNAVPNVPAGRASSRAIRVSTSAVQPIEPAGELLALEARRRSRRGAC